jgi:hypothetical protein
MKYIFLIIILIFNIQAKEEKRYECTNKNFKFAIKKDKKVNKKLKTSYFLIKNVCDLNIKYDPTNLKTINNSFEIVYKLNEDIEKSKKLEKEAQEILENLTQEWMSLSQNCIGETKTNAYNKYRDVLGELSPEIKKKKRYLNNLRKKCKEELEDFIIQLLFDYNNQYLFEETFKNNQKK